MLPRRMMFDDFFDDFDSMPVTKNMLCDIYEEDQAYYIEIDAPGFSKEDITIECDKGTLKISAEKHFDEESGNKKYIHRERKATQKCVRSFYLGDIVEENIKANFKDGILKITVPKEEKKETKKQITIE